MSAMSTVSPSPCDSISHLIIQCYNSVQSPKSLFSSDHPGGRKCRQLLKHKSVLLHIPLLLQAVWLFSNILLFSSRLVLFFSKNMAKPLNLHTSQEVWKEKESPSHEEKTSSAVLLSFKQELMFICPLLSVCKVFVSGRGAT